jgi:hypothetical protein
MRAVAVMFLARLGSLHALEQSGRGRFWGGWLGGSMPSDDTVGRVCALAKAEDVRGLLHHLYSRVKRMKALGPPRHGLMAAVLDGHESHATYRRSCPGCSQRIIHGAAGDRVQSYHRYVALLLLGGDGYMMLDAEAQRPGEDEVAAALRLFDRAVAAYPRAFDVVVLDGLYANSTVFNHVLEKGKDVIAVLRDPRRDLLRDAQSLFEDTDPVLREEAGCRYAWWDMEGFTTWPQVARPVRVVRSLERRTVRRQRDKAIEEQRSDWVWVTTLARARASTRTAVALGHSRWTIENQGFNDMVNRWHTDHVYKHQPQAMLVFLLLAMACLNVFLAFYRRDLKSVIRRKATMLHIARLILADLYASLASQPSRAPP